MAGGEQKEELNHLRCTFCYSDENNWLELGPKKDLKDVVTHYYCLLLSSEMEQKGEDSEGILGFMLPDIKKEVTRGKKQKCTHCNKLGATIRCVVPKCKKNFHLPCGIRNGSLHQFYGHFRSYCGAHRPSQKIPANLLAELATGLPCAICLEELPTALAADTVWAPCCRKGAWFHRQCVQKLAISAGYFFKCPLCNNKDKFNKTMLDCGIFIPEQDASWETEPHAFEDLLHRHDQCDHPACRDPAGRTNNVRGTRWEVILCDLCGSQGVHMACGLLSWSNPEFQCAVCVGSRARAPTPPPANAAGPPEESESDESDRNEPESRPLSLAPSPTSDRTNSPPLFAQAETPAEVEEGTTTPPLAPAGSEPPPMLGPYPPHATQRRRGRPPLQKTRPPPTLLPAVLPPQAVPPGPFPAQPTHPAGEVFVALRQPTPPRKIEPTDAYAPFEFFDSSAPPPKVLPNFTVFGSDHVFQPKSFSESVQIPTVPPTPPVAVRILNHTPPKVLTTARSTLFPQSQNRVVVPMAKPSEIVIDLLDDSDDDIVIIEDVTNSKMELVTRDGSKIPVISVPAAAAVGAESVGRATESPDLEIIEALSTVNRRRRRVRRYIRRDGTAARLEDNLSPLRVALQMPPLAPTPGLPGERPGQTPGTGPMLAPRRMRPIRPAPAAIAPGPGEAVANGTPQRDLTAQQSYPTSPSPKAPPPTATEPLASARSPARRFPVLSSPRQAFRGNARISGEVVPTGFGLASWATETGRSPKQPRLQSPSGARQMPPDVRQMPPDARLLVKPPSYEETMQNDIRSSQSSFLPADGSSARPGVTGGSYLITDPSASFGSHLLDGNLYKLSRTNVTTEVSSYMLTPVGSAFVRANPPQQTQSVGGNAHASHRRRLECDPGSAASTGGAPRSGTAATTATTRSENQAGGQAHQASASKAIGSAAMPGSDHNRLINVFSATFNISQPNLIKMTVNFKETLIPLTKPDKRILIPVKPTEYWAESVPPPPTEGEPLAKPKLQRAKRGAAFARKHQDGKPRKRRVASMWSKGFIKPMKKKVNIASAGPISAGSSGQAPLDSALSEPFSTMDANPSVIEGSCAVVQPPLIKNSPETEHTPITRASTATETTPATLTVDSGAKIKKNSSVKRCLVVAGHSDADRQSFEEREDIKALSEVEGNSQSSPSSAVKRHQSADYVNYRRRNIDAVSASAQGQCLTRRTRSVMKAASLSTRSKVSLEKYSFKRGSHNYVPLLRQGYIPKGMKSSTALPKVVAVTAQNLDLDTEDTQAPSSDDLAVVDSEARFQEGEANSKESSFGDSFASFSDKTTDCEVRDGGRSASLPPDQGVGLADTMLGEISEDEDFYSSQGDVDDIDNEDDTVFIERTIKEYRNIEKISTVKAKALTARKFRPPSTTENMQREMLLKLREMPPPNLLP